MDKEYKDKLKFYTLEEVIEDCIYFANDGYYNDLEEMARNELANRLHTLDLCMEHTYYPNGDAKQVIFDADLWMKVVGI